MTDPLRTLELFAGLGGLGLALPPGHEIVAAYDQDQRAAESYEQAHGRPVLRKDLASVRPAELASHEAPAWLLSPPCQPFTHRGAHRDIADRRCQGLLKVVEALGTCRPELLLVENVPGFFGSRMHGLLREALAAIGHEIAELELCPSELGAPIRRRRQFLVSSARGLAPARGPAAPQARRPLAGYLDPDPDEGLRVPQELRDRLDDHLPTPGRDGLLGTFTRSYGRAITGAGPLLWDERGPRWFSPEEILRLHEFPADFRFPEGLNRRERWRLAGNSVHLGCVRRALEHWQLAEAA